MCIPAKASEATTSPSPPQSSPVASSTWAHCESSNSVVRKAPISSLLPASSPLHSPEQKVVGIKCLNSNFSGVATITSTKPLWAPQENDAPLNLSKDFHSQKVVFHFFKVFYYSLESLSFCLSVCLTVTQHNLGQGQLVVQCHFVHPPGTACIFACRSMDAMYMANICICHRGEFGLPKQPM